MKAGVPEIDEKEAIRPRSLPKTVSTGISLYSLVSTRRCFNSHVPLSGRPTSISLRQNA